MKDIEVTKDMIGRKGGKHEKINLEFGVCQYGLNGKFIARYDSIRDASYVSGVSYSGIWRCIMGQIKKSGGYFWRREEGDE